MQENPVSRELERLQSMIETGDFCLRRNNPKVNRGEVLSARWGFARLLGIEHNRLEQLRDSDGVPRTSNLLTNFEALRNVGIENPADIYNRDRKTITLSGEKIRSVTDLLGKVGTHDQIREIVIGKPSVLTYSEERIKKRVASLVLRGYSISEIASTPQLFAKGKTPKSLR